MKNEIKKEWFMEGENPKIKLNFFLYEVALEYYTHIKQEKSLEWYRRKHKDREIAEFCRYYAKQMKKSILERLAGKTDATVIDEEYITSFYPKNSRKQNNLLLETACIAWDKLLSVCERCPTRCISEKDQYCVFFDDPFY